MWFAVLGETQAWRDDGTEVPLGGPARRALLALLLTRPGTPVPADRLIEEIHGGDLPPDGAAHALQSQVSRLRSALRPGAAIEISATGYRIDASPDDVDAWRFERVADEAHRALGEGDPARAAELLRTALGWWRGAAFADIADGPSGRVSAERLEERRLAALEDRIDADLRLGGAHGAVPELRELIGRQPLRERPRALLMRALQAQGRPAEALAAFDEARRTLAAELGADPSAELTALHAELLRDETVPVRGPSAPPAQLTSFVGREQDVRELGAQLATARLVTLLGPGGVGKTRMAIEVAARRDDETCFVELAPLRDGAGLPQAVLRALGLGSGGLLATPAGTMPPEARLVAALSEQPPLLVLDNCEHVADDVAALAHTLLSACPDLRVLATSREPLGITGEHLWPVRPLDGEAALRLFADRAAAARRGFVLDDGNRRDVQRICAALDDLPLAIELAAARLRTHDVAAVAAGLDDRFALLSRGGRTAGERHRTMRATVAWSWDLLSGEEQRAARRFTVFAGSADAVSAQAVCGVPDAADVLESLADKSLLEVAGGRYRMLETIRAYGAERLRETSATKEPREVGATGTTGETGETGKVGETGKAGKVGETRQTREMCQTHETRMGEAGETRKVGETREAGEASGATEEDVARRAHAGRFLDLARTADPHLHRGEQLQWLAVIAAEHDDLLAAVGWAVEAGEVETALRLLASMATYLWIRGLSATAAGYAAALLDRIGPGAPPGLEAEYVVCALITAADPATTGVWCRHQRAAGAAIMAAGGRRHPFVPFRWLMVTAGGDDAVAAHALIIAERESAEPWARAAAHLMSGYPELAAGDVVRAEQEFTAAVETFRTAGDRWGTALALDALAGLAALCGDTARAIALTDEALGLSERLGAVEDRSDLLCNRGDYRAEADPEGARADYTHAAGLARRAGRPTYLAAALRGLGDLALRDGDLGAARRRYEEALDRFDHQWIKSVGNRARALVGLGAVAEAGGDPAGARDLYRRAIGVAVSMGALFEGARGVVALAGTALAAGDPGASATLLGAAASLRGTAAAPGAEASLIAAAARTALGDGPFGTAHRAGTRMSHPDALRLAGVPESVIGAAPLDLLPKR